MIAVLTLCGVVMTVVTLKVKRLIWSEDKILPLVFMFMTSSIVMSDFYFMVQVGAYSKIGWIFKNSYLWAFMLTYYTAILLLIIGVVLNVHKWIQFLLRIQTSIKVEKLLDELKVAQRAENAFEDSETTSKPTLDMLPVIKNETETLSRSQLFKKYNSYLNIATTLIIVLSVLYYYIQISRYCISGGG